MEALHSLLAIFSKENLHVCIFVEKFHAFLKAIHAALQAAQGVLQ